jgi:hypothetical protein
MAILLLSMLRSDVHDADDKRLDAGHCDDRAAVTVSDKNARVFLKVEDPFRCGTVRYQFRF